MDIWDEIKKLTGYQSGNGGVDSYGVDHSGFSTRDELEYQSARLARENQLAENFSKQGIAEENYPIYGTNFWGRTPENNYGFGTSNIKQNIENVTNRLNNNTNNGQVFANSDYTVNTESLVGKPSGYFQNNNSVFPNNNAGNWGNNYTGNTNTTIGQPNNSMQNIAQDNSSAWDSVKNFTQNAVNAIAPYTPTYYVGYGIGTAQNTFNKLKDLYGAYKQNGATYAAQQYGEPSVRQAMKAADWLSPLDISDVNKHRYVSCVGSTGGPLATAETLAGGVKKEIDDYNKKMNNEDLLKQYGGQWGVIGDGLKDLGNDVIGAWKGLWSDNPEECEELLPEQYRKKKRYW